MRLEFGNELHIELRDAAKILDYKDWVDCDDIIWITPCNPYNSLRTDMKYPSGIIHFWLKDHVFKIGASLSSTTIFVTPQNEK